MSATRLRVTRGPYSAVRRKMKDPVSRRLVLPPARLEQIAHHGHRAGATHALRSLRGSRETEHLMAPGDEELDQLGADEAGAPVTNAVAPPASTAMSPVWRTRGWATTDKARTALVRRPYTARQ